MKKLVSMTVCLFVLVGFANAQKFKPALDFLKGETKINVIFDYSKVVYDDDSQEEYYKEKDKSWVEKWEGERRLINNSWFLNNLNDELKDVNVIVGEFPNAQYTMVVYVIDCDFGSYAGPMSTPASVECKICFMKTGTTQALSCITLNESQDPYSAMATAVDFDRIYLAFGEVGDEVGDKLVKVLKK